MNAPIAVSVVADSPLLPGGEITAAVTVDGSAAVIVELVREERWRRKMADTSAHSSGDDFLSLAVDTAVELGPDVTTALEEHERWTEDTAELGTLTGGGQARLRIPQDAAPSAPPHVRWLVVASVPGAGEDAATAEAEVELVTSPETVQPTEDLVLAGGDEDQISVRLAPGAAVRAGGTLHGVVALHPKKGRTFSDVRLLAGWVRGDVHGKTEDRSLVSETLAQGLEVAAGNTTELSFSIPVPADLPASFRTAHNRSIYTIWATGALRMRKDVESWRQFRVASAAGS